VVAGVPPALDLAAEKNLIDCLVKLASERAVLSAHDVSDGGLAITLAECCFDSAGEDATCLSADTTIDFGKSEAYEPAEAALFGERGGRVIVSVAPPSLARVTAIAAQCNVQAKQIGTVTRGAFRIQFKGKPIIYGDIDSFRKIWSSALGKVLASV
jgi:phosphoribosylformylglycinamidine (FGAM) synthase-like enzyme